MASYFDEHDCDPDGHTSTGQSSSDSYPNLLHLVRAYLAGDELPDWLSEITNSPNFDNEALAPPASKKVVEELKRRCINRCEYEEEIKCPVCIMQFDTEDTLVELPCEHAFHAHCILPWLEKTNTCPNCRDGLPTDNPAYEQKKREKERQEQRLAREQGYQDAMFG